MIVIPFGLAFLTVAFYLWVGRKPPGAEPTLSDFFVFGHKLQASSFFQTVSGSSISLGAAILAFLSLGFYTPWVAILATLTWLLGFLFHYLVIKRIFLLYPDIQQRLFTLHGYLGRSYQSDSLTLVAASASIFGFAGAYGIEMVAITKLITPYANSALLEVTILLLMCAALGLYTSQAGFVSVVRTAKWQLWFIAFGILIAVWLLINKIGDYNQIYSTVSRFLSFSEQIFPTALVLGLLFINVPWQIIDMSQWQRSLSCESLSVIRTGLLQSAVGIGIGWATLIFLGVLLHVLPTVTDPVEAFLFVFNGHPVLYGCFLIAAVAAMFSTADTYVIAATQSYVFDIMHPEFMNEHEPNLAQQKKLLQEARSTIWKISLMAPVFAYGARLIIPNLLDLFFMVFSAQLSLLPSMLVTIMPTRIRSANAAFSSIIAGLACSLILFILALAGSGSPDLVFLSPIVTLIVSSSVYTLIRMTENIRRHDPRMR